MTLATSTLRPGFLVSLKTSVRGNVRYFRKPLDATTTQTDGVAIDRWETERTVHDPKENDAAKKARAKASGLVRSVCQQSVFGLLCPEIDIEKLDKAIAEAKQVVDAFNETATLSRISIFVLAGKVSPDDVEAVRAINSEIRELMAEMSTGIANGNVESIREAASRVKGIGEMLATDARAKVQIAVEVGRGVAKKIVSDIKERGSSVDVDRSAIKRIDEMRMAFLDLEDATEVAAPKPAKGALLDLAAE